MKINIHSLLSWFKSWLKPNERKVRKINALPLSDELLEAVGAYTVYFSLLDSMITKVLSILLLLNEKETRDLAQDIQTTSTRIKLLKYLGRKHVTEATREEFNRTIKSLLDANGQRNKFIHWIWTIGADGQPRVSSPLTGRKPEKVSIDKLWKETTKINTVTTQLREFGEHLISTVQRASEQRSSGRD